MVNTDIKQKSDSKLEIYGTKVGKNKGVKRSIHGNPWSISHQASYSLPSKQGCLHNTAVDLCCKMRLTYQLISRCDNALRSIPKLFFLAIFTY